MGRNGNRLQVPQFAAALLGTTILAGFPGVAQAQDAPASTADAAAPAADAPAPAQPTPAPAPAQEQIIRSITVTGAERLEPSTVLSYIKLRVGQPYSQVAADQALKDLYGTELISDASIRNDNGDVTIQIKENPVINRIILEGNKRIKDDKIQPEIKLAPREIFTRSKVRADVDRIIELYKRQGRFAATVEPKSVALPQNRVDIIFEIHEGPKSKVRQINIIGNEKFSDGELREQMATKQSRWFRVFSSGTSYDPDKLAYDQQKLRQFYLTQGYADFRVVSAVAELTPDKKDFIITYVVEEGKRYKFGDISVESQIRDFDGASLTKQLAIHKGDWYNAKAVEDTVDSLTQTAGTFGYAFANVDPEFTRDKDNLTMSLKFVLKEAPRVYVEAVNVNGNTLTQDKVVRREFRITEGDAFNSFAVKRSTERIKSLGYFQENFEVQQAQGSAPDRIVLNANVQEQATGELQLSAGFSSLESFILSASVQQRNFRGRGQIVGISANYSSYQRSFQLSFTEPYVWDKNFSFGMDVYRTDVNNWNEIDSDRNTTFQQDTTGFQMRAGVPLTEYLSLIGRYTLNLDNVTLDRSTYFTDMNGDGILGNSDNDTCDPLRASRYLCDALGKRTSSIVGFSLVSTSLDNRVHPTRGSTWSLNLDFSGLGGSVKYAKFRANYGRYWPLGGGWIFSVNAEGGYIKGLGSGGPFDDPVRLTDRFFLGEPQMRGFDIRGVGPRIIRQSYAFGTDANGTSLPACADGSVAADCSSHGGYTFTDPSNSDNLYQDALGGDIYYLGKVELEIPLGSGAREMGLRPSIFMDVGSVFHVREPQLIDTGPNGVFYPARDANGNPLYTQVDAASVDATTGVCTATSTSTVTNPVNPNPPACLTSANNTAQGTNSGAFREVFLGDTAKPRLSVGIGVNWKSPFGPFRIDFAKVLLKQKGDDTKAFSFNVGTQF